MEIIKPMKVDKIVYRCRCQFCGTKVEMGNADLKWYGAVFYLGWDCPICGLRNDENVMRLKSKKVTCYKEVSSQKG